MPSYKEIEWQHYTMENAWIQMQYMEEREK